MSVSRSFPDRPFLAVSAVISHGDRILLVEQGKPPLEGVWSLPGGVVEAGETLKTAIQREIREESGLSFEPFGVSELVEVIAHDDQARCERHFVIAVFTGSATTAPDPSSVDRLPRLVAGDDAKDARWVRIDDLSRYPLTKGTDEVIAKLIKTEVAPLKVR